MELLHLRDANSTLWIGDDAFGPQVGNRFDFTLFFEYTILTTLPACLLLFVSPFYIYRFLRRPISFRHGLLLWTKLVSLRTMNALSPFASAGWLTSASQVVAVLLLSVELANTVLISRDGSLLRSSASIAASVLSCTSMLAVVTLIYTEHRRSLRSSSFLSAFLSITTLFNIARARSYISRGGLDTFGALQVTIAVLKLALVSLEEVSKQSLLQPQHGPSMGPETRGGFWNRLLFVWVNNTLFIGFRKAISVEELPDIGLEFSPERLSAKFQRKWKAGQHTSPQLSMFLIIDHCPANHLSRYCLPIATMKALAWPLVAIVVPRLCFTAFTFAQPFLLHTIVAAVGQQELSRDVIGSLIGATALVYFGLAVSLAITRLTLNILSNRFAGHQSVLYTRRLQVSHHEPRNARLCNFQAYSPTRLGHCQGVGRYHAHEQRRGQHRGWICHDARPLGGRY
jgi:hypothetical protein